MLYAKFLSILTIYVSKLDFLNGSSGLPWAVWRATATPLPAVTANARRVRARMQTGHNRLTPPLTSVHILPDYDPARTLAGTH